MSNADAYIIERCKRIGTSTWSDALDQFALPGVMSGVPRRSGDGLFAGFAVTAREIAGNLGDFPPSDFGVGKIIAAANPGEVLVIDIGGAEVSTFGGLASLAAKSRGIAAVVIDGGCRDVDEAQATGLWMASRFVTPMTGKKRLRLESLGSEVRVGGILVNQRDLIVGDATGIVVIPQADIDRVITAAEKMLKTDHQMGELIKTGRSFSEAASTAKYI